jgi:oxidoreductase
MANPKSMSFNLRSKGLTEQALAELGYKDTIVFRPGSLTNANRPEMHLAESMAQYVSSTLQIQRHQL